MKHSRMTHVLKTGGFREPFDPAKLTASLWRGLKPVGGDHRIAEKITEALCLHLKRSERDEISSDEIFSLSAKALRRIRRGEAAELLELHRSLRAARRRRMVVRHENGSRIAWKKDWLASLAVRMWGLSPRTGRILAATVEQHLLMPDESQIARDEVIEMLNETVAQFGLADAVPLQPFANKIQ